MIRDDELKRLEAYAKALGISIVRKRSTSKSPVAEWAMDGSEIILYDTHKYSKTQEIIILIHELSHHKSHIARGRKEYIKTHQAYNADNEKDVPAKRHRKVIYEEELNDTQYWDTIIKDVNIKINPIKIEIEKRFDIWSYKCYYRDWETDRKSVV